MQPSRNVKGCSGACTDLQVCLQTDSNLFLVLTQFLYINAQMFAPKILSIFHSASFHISPPRLSGPISMDEQFTFFSHDVWGHDSVCVFEAGVVNSSLNKAHCHCCLSINNSPHHTHTQHPHILAGNSRCTYDSVYWGLFSTLQTPNWVYPILK